MAHRDPSVVLRGTQYVVPESDGIHQGITGANVVVAAADVHLGVQTLTVVTERPLSEALALTLRTVLITVGLIVAALVCAALLGFYAARRIVRPIRALAATAQAISAGELSRKAETTGHDELGLLGSTFNRMTAQLRDMIESLEERVEERTKELSETNAALETEIAERRRAEGALQDTVQRLRALIQASPLPIVSLDRDLKIQIWNPAAERVFGWSQQELVARPLPLVPDEAQEEFRLYWEQILHGKAVSALDVRRQRKDDSLLDVSIWSAPLYDQDGQVSGAIGVIADLAERKRAEETGRELAVVAERNRIAGEIHDTLIQSLMLIAIQLDVAARSLGEEPEAARAALESARGLARECLEEARRSVWELEPLALASRNLNEAIQREVARASQEGLHVSLDVDEDQAEAMDRRNELAVPSHRSRSAEQRPPSCTRQGGAGATRLWTFGGPTPSIRRWRWL